MSVLLHYCNSFYLIPMAAIQPQGHYKTVKKDSLLKRKARRYSFIISLIAWFVLSAIIAIAVVILSPLFLNVTSNWILGLVAILLGGLIFTVNILITSDKFELIVSNSIVSRTGSKEATRRRLRMQKNKASNES